MSEPVTVRGFITRLFNELGDFSIFVSTTQSEGRDVVSARIESNGVQEGLVTTGSVAEVAERVAQRLFIKIDLAGKEGELVEPEDDIYDTACPGLEDEVPPEGSLESELNDEITELEQENGDLQNEVTTLKASLAAQVRSNNAYKATVSRLQNSPRRR